jgi:hypothetical protein
MELENHKRKLRFFAGTIGKAQFATDKITVINSNKRTPTPVVPAKLFSFYPAGPGSGRFGDGRLRGDRGWIAGHPGLTFLRSDDGRIRRMGPFRIVFSGSIQRG